LNIFFWAIYAPKLSPKQQQNKNKKNTKLPRGCKKVQLINLIGALVTVAIEASQVYQS